MGITALQLLGDPAFNSNMLPSGELRSLWDDDRVARLSHLRAVARVICRGCVLVVELKVPEGSGGYASGAAQAVTKRLRSQGVYARPLGNVAYVMVTPTSSRVTTDRLLDALEQCI